MLRNTRIRTRLALMAIAPAVTALIVVVLQALLLPSTLIGGSSYAEIVTGKSFQASTVAPSLYIVDVNTKVQHLIIMSAAGRSIAQDRQDVAGLRARYETEYANWTKKNRLTDPQAQKDLEASHAAAQDYFKIYETQLLPAVDARRTTIAATIFDTQLSTALYFHSQRISAAALRVGQQVDAQEKAADERIQRQRIGIVAVTLLIVAVTVAVGITVLRSITDRVRRLSEIATVELPQVLGEVRRAALAGEEIPRLPQPTGDDGDELAAAGNAFNAVVATAVDLAAEQSQLRRATSQMFINLGRRNHKLLSRTLTYITQLESDERDPATLQNLFRLDHLTTRMRRHAESLLVLAGSPPLRTWSRPVPVADVLRAALSEIETYDRVDIKELEPVEVRGASVSDLAHLLAELLENATAFSPPQTRVRVLGRTDSEGYTIVVVDEGIGMSADELAAANDLVQVQDDSGILSDSRMLGLGVVGRLAFRHGFLVNLTASPVGGVVAWVTLPTSALAARRSDGEPAVDGAPRPVGPPFGDALPRQHHSPAQPAGAADRRPDAAALIAARTGWPLTDPAPEPDDAPPVQAAATSGSDTPELIIDLRDEPHHAAQVTAAGPSPADAGHPMAAAAQGPGGHGGGTNGASVAAGSPFTGGVLIPPAPPHAPASGAIAFRTPSAPANGANGLTRRVRGAQLPDTGEVPGTAGTTADADRPERSAQSVRGALQSFAAGRRSASDVTLGNARPITAPIELGSVGPDGASPANRTRAPRHGAAAAPGPAASAPAAAAPAAAPASATPPAAATLPRRVRGAQLPATDLPEAAPAPGRSAADVRAALSNFVAGRRAAEHEN